MTISILLKLSEIVFDENATASDLMTLALALAIFWNAFFAMTTAVLRPLVYGKPWLIKAGERDYERSGKEMCEKLGMKLTKKEYIETVMHLWPWNQAIVVQHHSLTTCLGVPAVLYYRNLKILHWVCFDLQAAAASALAIAEYTKLLDVTKPKQLRQFQFLTFVGLVVVLWTRGLHWFYLCAQVIVTMYHDKKWALIAAASLPIILFTGFNYFLCIQPFYTRFIKFWKASAEYISLPATANEQTRRSSATQLEAAAASLCAHNGMQDELLEALYSKRDEAVTRRQTIPPSMFGSHPRRRSSTMALCRASVGDVSHLLSQINAARETWDKEE